MANEISLTASLTGYKPSVMSSALSRAVTGFLANMAGNLFIEGVASIGTSATVIPLGQVTSPHWAAFYNTDAANYLTIRNGAGGADLLKLLAGEWAFCPLLDTAAPYGVAHAAACILEYLIFSL